MEIRSINAEMAYFFVVDNLLPNDEDMYKVTLSYFESKNVMIFGCFQKENLIAIGCLSYYPYTELDQYPQKVGFTEEEATLLLRIEASFVSPKFRGIGLQGVMLRYREQFAKERGYKYLCVSMHPDNVSNQRAVIKEGFILQYNELDVSQPPRMIFTKEI